MPFKGGCVCTNMCIVALFLLQAYGSLVQKHHGKISRAM